MKAIARRGKRGPNNTHFVVRVGMASIGTLYIPNDVADKYPDLVEFDIELPFEE